MTFYRRYSGLQPPTLPAAPGTGPIPGRNPAGSITPASPTIFAPTPREVESFIPTQPIRSYAPPLFSRGTAASLLPPGSVRANSVLTSPVAPGAVQAIFDHPMIRAAAASDDKATKAIQTAKDAQRDADAAIFNASKAAAKADVDPNAEAAAKAAANAAARAQQQAAEAEKQSSLAQIRAQIDAGKAQKVVADGVASPKNDGGSVPYDTSGGGYDPYGSNGTVDGIPDGAYGGEGVGYVTTDDGHRYVIEQGASAPPPGTVMPNGGTVISAGHPYLLAAGAAGAGFLVGGPIGALVGAAAGYFFSKK